MLAVLVPAILFYLLVTLVCIYFSYYSVSSEVRERHIQEALYVSAVIDTNYRELLLIGRSLNQSMRDYKNVNVNVNVDEEYVLNHLLALMSQNQRKAILGVGFYNANTSSNSRNNYWDFDGSSFNKKKHHSVSAYIEGKLKEVLDNKNSEIKWITDPVTKDFNVFRSSLLIPLFSPKQNVVIHIDIDGDVFCSYHSLGKEMSFSVGSWERISQGDDREHDNKDTRLHFSKYFTLRDREGITIYTKGHSARYYRRLSEQVLKMEPIEGASCFLTYDDIDNRSFFDFILKNRIKKVDYDIPNNIFLDVHDRVALDGEIIHFRFSNRGVKLWCSAIPINSANWMLTAYMRERDILKPIYDQFLVCVMLSVLAVFVAIMTLWFVAGLIAGPLKRLKNSMNSYVQSLEPTASFKEYKNEVVSLKVSFDQLIACIDDRDKALYEARINNISFLANQLQGRYFYFNLDCVGNIIHISPSVKTVLGFDRGFFKGKFSKYLTSTSVKNVFINNLNKVFTGRLQDAFEVEMCHKDGSTRCIELFFCLMPGIKPRQNSIEGIANDVTKRVVDTQKFKALIASAPDAVFITNRDGVISLINKKVVELFGYSSEELVNMPFSLVFDYSKRNDISLLKPLDSKFLDNHCLEGFQSFGLKKSGDVFPIEIASSVIETGRDFLVSVVVRDISERKIIEGELLAAKEKAERSDCAKTLFLSNMSHELRTPLNGILGYSQVLVNDQSLSEQYKMKVRSIEGCGRHLLKLINNILDFAKTETVDIDVEEKSFSLRTIIDNVVAIVENMVREKGLRLVFNVKNDVPNYLIGDKLKIQQVLINLINNAVKFTRDGFVSLSVELKEGLIHFYIRDTGIGISEKDQDKLFLSFSQLEAGRKLGGAGLGLAISHKLVKAMSGDLNVKSTPGKGSCFNFSLPYHPAVGYHDLGEEGKRYNCYMNNDTGNKENILFVGNVGSNTYLYQSLSDFGFVVKHYNKFNEIMSKLDSRSIIVLFPDLELLNELDEKDCCLGVMGKRMIAICSEGEKNESMLKRFFCVFCDEKVDCNELVEAILRCVDYNRSGDDIYNAFENKKLNKGDAFLMVELVVDIKKMLDIGDIDGIVSLVRGIKNDKRYGRYPDEILGMCENYDIESLERVVSLFSDINFK